mmetsp:Transcript_41624/g.134542  ORF Transcript_41624/g.134542 Transcript_41624/m.134542 type:complete len:236 (-) Transcript_41624:146-853(-)
MLRCARSGHTSVPIPLPNRTAFYVVTALGQLAATKGHCCNTQNGELSLGYHDGHTVQVAEQGSHDAPASPLPRRDVEHTCGHRRRLRVGGGFGLRLCPVQCSLAAIPRGGLVQLGYFVTKRRPGRGDETFVGSQVTLLSSHFEDDIDKVWGQQRRIGLGDQLPLQRRMIGLNDQSTRAPGDGLLGNAESRMHWGRQACGCALGRDNNDLGPRGAALRGRLVAAPRGRLGQLDGED